MYHIVYKKIPRAIESPVRAQLHFYKAENFYKPGASDSTDGWAARGGRAKTARGSRVAVRRLRLGLAGRLRHKPFQVVSQTKTNTAEGGDNLRFADGGVPIAHLAGFLRGHTWKLKCATQVEPQQVPGTRFPGACRQ